MPDDLPTAAAPLRERAGEAGDPDALDRFCAAFEKSSRRWELVVYPSLFAFILLAIYGFYLIYSITGDLHRIAVNMRDMSVRMESIAGHMEVAEPMYAQMREIRADMAKIALQMEVAGPMHRRMGEMSAEMTGISEKLSTMNRSVHNLSVSNAMMRRDMSLLTRQVARPMSLFNSFLP